MRDGVRSQCFDILSDAVSDHESAMAFADLKDYMKGLSEEALAGMGTDDRKKMQALVELREHARHFARESKDLGARMMREVRSAKADDLSEESLTRWHKRLKARHGKQWPDARRQITEFIDRTLPTLKKDWLKLRSDLKEVETLKGILGVSGRDLKALAALESPGFRKAKYPERRAKVTAALAALRAQQKNWKKRPGKETEGTRLYDDVRAFLKEAADDGSMSRTKIGLWLRRTFATRDLVKTRAFFTGTLKTFRANWRAVRERYDALHKDLAATGLPRGFTPVAPEAFLQKDYGARLAYVAMLDRRLHPAGKPATKLCSDIWHAFDAQDWNDADHLIAMLESDFPSHPDLGAMVTYLETHRDDAQEAAKDTEPPSDEQIQHEANQILRGYPEMDVLLGESMEKDSVNPQDANARTRLVGRMMYNLVWAEQRGYTSEEEQLHDVQDGENKEKTKEYIEDGHSSTVEKNIVGGDTAQKHAVREHNTAAQILYMKSDVDAQLAVFKAVDEEKGSEQFGYWVDLKPINMPTDRHHRFVNEDSKRLKALMWQARGRGTFVRSGHSVSFESVKKEAPATQSPAPVLATASSRL